MRSAANSVHGIVSFTRISGCRNRARFCAGLYATQARDRVRGQPEPLSEAEESARLQELSLQILKGNILKCALAITTGREQCVIQPKNLASAGSACHSHEATATYLRWTRKTGKALRAGTSFNHPSFCVKRRQWHPWFLPRLQRYSRRHDGFPRDERHPRCIASLAYQIPARPCAGVSRGSVAVVRSRLTHATRAQPVRHHIPTPARMFTGADSVAERAQRVRSRALTMRSGQAPCRHIFCISAEPYGSHKFVLAVAGT